MLFRGLLIFSLMDFYDISGWICFVVYLLWTACLLVNVNVGACVSFINLPNSEVCIALRTQTRYLNCTI